MFHILRIGVSTPSLFLFFSESVLIYLSLIVAAFLRNFIATGDAMMFEHLLPKALIVVFTINISLYYLDGYSGYFYARHRELLFFWVILQAVALSYIVLSIFYYIFPNFYIGRGILFIHFWVVTVFLYAWRIIFNWLFPKIEVLNRRAVIIGDDVFAQNLHAEILKHDYSGFSVFPMKVPPQENPVEDMIAFFQEKSIHLIIVTKDTLDKLPLEFLWQCHLRGYQILDGLSFYAWITGKVLYEELKPNQILFVYAPANLYITRFVKRCMDIVFCFLGVLITLPVQIMIGILIKLTSKGPIFYTQERTGLYEKPFIIYKYRTMSIDAEKTGPQQAQDKDPRVTFVGKYLRKTRLDELPQLFNILRGQMSLIGPRPERPHFTNMYKEKIPYYFLRHAVKPGLTGWAQVKHEYTNDLEGTCEKFRHDLYYIKYFSISLDILILIKTIKVILTGAGAK